MADSWMSEPYEPDNEIDRVLGSTDESWRGSTHAEDDESWRSSLTDGWDDDAYVDEEDPDAWQWDEPDPGPEPWLFRDPTDDDQAA